MLHASLIGLLVLLSSVSAVSPRSGSTFMQEKQHQQQQQEQQLAEEGDTSWELQLRDPTLPSSWEGAAAESMSCPSKPQEAGEPKIEWPELEGKTAEEAKAVLQQEAPAFKVQVIGPDMFATADYRCDRVRIWLNKQQRVSQPPRVG